MAANAANFYLTYEAKPSIFEIIAQRNLNASLQPALEKLAQFFASTSPKYLHWLATHYEESFLVLNGFLEYHYLKNHGASFSEYFYGLKRLRIDDYELSRLQKQLSWIYLVILPYFKSKFDRRINAFRFQEAEHSLRNDLRGKITKGLIRAHSLFEMTWGSWILVNYLRYMSDKCDAQLPSLKLLNIKLTYTNMEDNFAGFWSALFRGQLSCSELSGGLLQNGVRSIFEISAFFVQFLQAWNAEKANFNVKALPIIKPPLLDSKAANFKDKCPICYQNWKIPTVLPTSGYVFCFSCIFKYLQTHHKCPITNLPAKPLEIVRFYDT